MWVLCYSRQQKQRHQITEKSLGFYSKMLAPAQMKYGAFERELYAII
jgi:hypothetical protein